MKPGTRQAAIGGPIPGRVMGRVMGRFIGRGVVRLIGAAMLLLAACAPFTNAPGKAVAEPTLGADGFDTADGARLPVKSWLPDQGPPKAVIVALHGFNDYSNFFVAPALFLANAGIATYAYDQRGFGGSPRPGLWPGTAALTDDLRTFVGLIRKKHPGVPLYVLGESMGGAVVLVAAARPGLPLADGIILVAPAVWGRASMPWYQRLVLWLSVHTLPYVELTGQSLYIKPSDNIEMLRTLGRDPLVIKATRVDAVWGLVNLMDAALEDADRFDEPALILYGEKDEVIPRRPTRMMLARLPKAGAARRRVAIYPEGYHMLLRDLGSETAWKDILGWMADHGKPLPSGADRIAKSWLAAKDDD